jgi:hypothetical protein
VHMYVPTCAACKESFVVVKCGVRSNHYNTMIPQQIVWALGDICLVSGTSACLCAEPCAKWAPARAGCVVMVDAGVWLQRLTVLVETTQGWVGQLWFGKR